MTAVHYDVVVIGGGIHGAGVAQAAAARGHRTLILEQTEIAASTSRWSSKLIHGGLRYLEHGEIGLVRECLRERSLLLRNAPDLVQLKPFHIPIYRHSQRRSWEIFAGLSLYATLGGWQSAYRFQHLPRSQWESLDGIDTQNLQAVYRYWDGQTDDRLLTEAVIESALSLGAQLAMPAQVADIELTESGAVVRYRERGQEQECRAAVVINASGPWTNRVLTRIHPVVPQLQTRLVGGTHILVAGRLERGLYYVEAPQDKRPVFIMPWYDRIMVGTTEIQFRGDPASFRPSVAEKTYLLETLSYYFPRFRSQVTARVDDAFAGLRVLPAQPGHLNALPRDTVLHPDRPHKPRILTIYGGKLTAYRATADRVMRCVAASLPATTPKADTATLPLTRPTQ